MPHATRLHLVSSTALVASGATVLLFTTGRGTPARNELNGEREISIWKNGITP